MTNPQIKTREPRQYDCPICAEQVLHQVPLRTGIVECAFCGNEIRITLVVEPAGKQPHYTSEDWLRKEYEVEGRTMAEIAKQCVVSPMTINRWLNLHGIETRRRGQR